MRRPMWLVPVSLVVAATCDNALSVEDLSGSWEATEFTADFGDGPVDQLPFGAAISLTLHADGTTSGNIFVPEGAEDGGDFDEDLGGTWTLEDGIVTLEHTADTFLRNMPFTVEGERLVGENHFGDVIIRVVLERT